MKSKKIIVLLMALVLLCGCSKTEKLYDGLDAKETFSKAIDKLNELTYVNTHSEDKDIDSGEIIINDLSYYKVDDEYTYVQRTIMGDYTYYYVSSSKVNANLFDDGFGDTGINMIDETTKLEKAFNNMFENESITILDSSREDKDDKIIITVKRSSESYNSYEFDDEGNSVPIGEKITEYYTIQDTINKDGYLEEEVIKKYTDDTFKTQSDDSVPQKYIFSSYNKNSDLADEFAKLIKTLSDLEGQPFDEVSKKLDKFIK